MGTWASAAIVLDTHQSPSAATCNTFQFVNLHSSLAGDLIASWFDTQTGLAVNVTVTDTSTSGAAASQQLITHGQVDNAATASITVWFAVFWLFAAASATTIEEFSHTSTDTEDQAVIAQPAEACFAVATLRRHTFHCSITVASFSYGLSATDTLAILGESSDMGYYQNTALLVAYSVFPRRTTTDSGNATSSSDPAAFLADQFDSLVNVLDAVIVYAAAEMFGAATACADFSNSSFHNFACAFFVVALVAAVDYHAVRSIALSTSHTSSPGNTYNWSWTLDMASVDAHTSQATTALAYKVHLAGDNLESVAASSSV